LTAYRPIKFINFLYIFQMYRKYWRQTADHKLGDLLSRCNQKNYWSMTGMEDLRAVHCFYVCIAVLEKLFWVRRSVKREFLFIL